MVQKYIFFHVQKRGKRKRWGALGEAKYPNKLPWKGERKKKIPNYLEVRIRPKLKANVCIKEQVIQI